jgi:putative component of membrane protein insertase Oxa1/YidC/SpoIIIJ protein YidD
MIMFRRINRSVQSPSTCRHRPSCNRLSQSLIHGAAIAPLCIYGPTD